MGFDQIHAAFFTEGGGLECPLLPAHTSCEVQMKYHFLSIGLANKLDIPQVSLTKQVMFVHLLKD